jgi:perosamine synthetase
MQKIPVCEPTLGSIEREYLIKAFDSGFISGNGEFCQELETKFAQYHGSSFAVSVNTGTAAVHLAIEALELPPGSEIIVPTFTMAGSVFPIIQAGLVPVFIDAREDTWCIDAKLIEEKISSRTRAILVVHIYGNPCDMRSILKIASEYDLHVIEDAAEAIGSEINGNKCGSFGDTAAFSLFANKAITSGEGGIVLTNKKNIFENLLKLRNLYFPLTGERRYEHEKIGYNYRMSNLLAAIGCAQYSRIDELVQARIQNAKLYNLHLGHSEFVKTQVAEPGAVNSYWMFGVIIEQPENRVKEIRQMLQQNGIETRPFFKGMHSQAALQNRMNLNHNNFPVCEMLHSKGFYLPSSSHLTHNEIEYVSEKLLAAIKVHCH